MSEARAVVFDLDDTLYPHRWFIASGFRRAATFVEREHGVPAAQALSTLFRARAEGGRGRELQALCGRFGLPDALVLTLRTIIRDHVPTLRLPRVSCLALERLRRAGWRLGILTNGEPAVQQRKVAALGVAPLVDTVVLAHACGDGRGKPDRAGFDAVLGELGTSSASTVFVGDDPVADVQGAAWAGMRTIQLRRSGGCPHNGPGLVLCDAVVTTLEQVPEVAERLVFTGDGKCHSRLPAAG